MGNRNPALTIRDNLSSEELRRQVRRENDGQVRHLDVTPLWDDYLDKAFRDRAPRLVVNNDGKEMLLIEEKILGSQQGMGGIGGVGARQGRSRPRR